MSDWPKAPPGATPFKVLRLLSPAPAGDDPHFYDWSIEGRHWGSDVWVKIAESESNYDSALAIVELYNANIPAYRKP